MFAISEHAFAEGKAFGTENIGSTGGMPETWQFHRIVGNLHADELTALGQSQFANRPKLVHRQMPIRLRRIGNGLGKSDFRIHGKEEAGPKRMGNAQEITEIHRFGNAVDANGEISAHTIPACKVLPEEIKPRRTQ